MKSSTKMLGVLFSLIFSAGTIFGFFWLYTSMGSEDSASTATTGTSSYQQIEISSVKKEAEEILSDKTKITDIPVLIVPDKMGKDNPFK